MEDFDRLDSQFRIRTERWRSLPGYERMGLAVFKLKAGRQAVHPMCLPTLHIYDGKVHPREEFDHELYPQGNREQAPDVTGWKKSRGWAGQFMKTELTAGILLNEGHVYRRRLSGELPNKGTYVTVA